MGILRVQHQDNYFPSSRHAAQDSRLSIDTRGLLWYLISKPKDWTIRHPDLMREAGVKRFALRRMLREMERYGYLVRQKLHRRGRLDWDSVVCDVPEILATSLNTRGQSLTPCTTGQSSTGCPPTDCSLTSIQNIEEQQITDSQSIDSTNESTTTTVAVAPPAGASALFAVTSDMLAWLERTYPKLFPDVNLHTNNYLDWQRNPKENKRGRPLSVRGWQNWMKIEAGDGTAQRRQRKTHTSGNGATPDKPMHVSRASVSERVTRSEDVIARVLARRGGGDLKGGEQNGN